MRTCGRWEVHEDLRTTTLVSGGFLAVLRPSPAPAERRIYVRLYHRAADSTAELLRETHLDGPTGLGRVVDWLEAILA